MIGFRYTALVIGLGCLAGGQPLLAQQLSISGNVTDGTGVIPDAKVSLRDPGGVVTDKTTDGAGKYTFDGLRPGGYELSVSRDGFRPGSNTITLTTVSGTVDFTLQVAGGTTSIDVHDVAGRGTASGMDVEDKYIPSYVVRVPARILQEQGITELSQALDNVSGVMTQKQYGVYEWYTIGGISQQSGNDFLYVDGMTMTGNRSATQLNNIEEVQVLKGPNSILYGGAGSGQGGMVNLVRKKPTAVRAHELQYRLGRWGTNQFTGASTGTVFGLGRLLYRVDGSISKADGWRQNGADRNNLSPSLTFLITEKMRVTANQTFIHDNYTLDSGVRIELINRPGGFPFDRKMNPAGDFQETRMWQNQIVYTWNVTKNLTLNSTFYKQRSRDQYLDAETMGYNAATDQVTRAYFYYQRHQRPVQSVTDLQGDYYLFGMRHQFLARYTYSDQFKRTDRTGNAPGASNSPHLPLSSIPVKDFLAGTWVDDAPTYRNFPLSRLDSQSDRYHTVVLQDLVFPVQWLAFNFVINRSNWQRQIHFDNYDSGVFLTRGPEQGFENKTKNNYRAGVVLVPKATWAPFFRSFMPYFSYNSSFNPVQQISADGKIFDPVINESFEVGMQWKGFSNRLSVISAARRIQDQNRLVSLGMMLFEQVGKATTYNMDLDIQGNIGRGYAVLANYGFADSLIDRLRTDGLPQANAGRRFPQAPKHTSRIWITKTIRLGEVTKLNLSLGGRYVGRYFANAANTARVPSRTTMDGAVSVTHKRVDVAVNFDNLLNAERYFVSQINSGSLLYPGQPFSATATVRYRFQ